jgi:negative regulator of sigma E activity
VFAHERIVLSDGFAWVEIYTQKNDHKPKLTRGQQLDAWHIYKGVSSGKNISVEGQLPYAVLEKIGLNMTLVLKDD